MALQYSLVHGEPDDVLKCCICLEVARDPKQEEGCGKLFCSGCIEELEEDSSCPTCSVTEPRYFKDKKSELNKVIIIICLYSVLTLGHREIQALGVRCVERDCGWEGTVGTLEDHMTKCDFTMTP